MGSEPSFTARIDSRNGVARIVLAGELDMDSLTSLTDRLKLAELDGARTIALDLRDLTFMDSSGLRALLQARDRARTNGHRFVIVGVGPSVRRVFEVSGMESLLDDDGATNILDQFIGRSDARHADRASRAKADGNA